MKKIRLNHYEYIIRDGKRSYTGSYTIREGINPLGYEGERLVCSFTYRYFDKEERQHALDE